MRLTYILRNYHVRLALNETENDVHEDRVRERERERERGGERERVYDMVTSDIYPLTDSVDELGVPQSSNQK